MPTHYTTTPSNVHTQIIVSSPQISQENPFSSIAYRQIRMSYPLIVCHLEFKPKPQAEWRYLLRNRFLRFAPTYVGTPVGMPALVS
jgi:hypothetical protein